jgi:quercetin dioxygenase-like cupin family protein
MKKTVVAALLLAALPAVASAMDKMAVQPDALKWGAAPASLPPGAQIAVLTGDPGKDGPYVVRVRLPAGYKIAPHTHPTAENVTVLSGTFHIAMGEKFDPKKGEAVRAGGFFTAEKDMQHYG